MGASRSVARRRALVQRWEIPVPSSEGSVPVMMRAGNVAASRGSSPGLDARCSAAALLLFTVLASTMVVAQQTPQPIFTELFAYDPAAPSQLLEKWRISSQLDSKLQPLRVGVVEDPVGKTVGRVTVQEGDGLEGASDAMLQARRYVCDSKGSRAAAMEAQRGGFVPSERAEIQVRSDRATGAGELVKFGQPVWYRFSFKIAGDWPQDVPAADASPAARSSTRSSRIPSWAESRVTPVPSSRSRRGRSASACASSRK